MLRIMIHCQVLLALLLLANSGASAWLLQSSVNPFSVQAQRQSLRLFLAEQLSAAASTRSSSVSGISSTLTLDGNEIRAPVTAVGNNLIVKVKDTITATSGGILLPDQSKQRPTEGLVLAAGPGKLHPDTGIRITNPIVEGMSVV